MGDVIGNADIGDSGVVELTGKVMMVAIGLLLFIVVFVFCIHLYAKLNRYRSQENASSTTTRVVVPAARRGLDLSALKTIPVIVYNPKEFIKGGSLECAVCLCDVSEGEKVRILPKCSHGFHVECIDMWFQSHSTCPLCRNLVSDQNKKDGATLQTILQAPRTEHSGAANVFPAESANFPTNVLIWGDETRVSALAPENYQQVNNSVGEPSGSSSLSMLSSPGSALEIEIPRQINEDEEQKSPMPTRLRSLQRLLSGNRRVNPTSPRNLDLEQGGSVQS